jgi:hypothetical protein
VLVDEHIERSLKLLVELALDTVAPQHVAQQRSDERREHG